MSPIRRDLLEEVREIAALPHERAPTVHATGRLTT
jgi:hypothetical protein